MIEGADDRFKVGPLFRQPLLWVGFLIPLFVGTWNSLARFYPFVLRIKTGQYLYYKIGGSWVNARWDIKFPIIGFTYLMKLEVALSVWLFAILHLAYRYTLTYLKYNVGHVPDTPWTYHIAPLHQSFGGLVVFVIFIAFVGRGQIRDILKKAFGRGRAVDDSNEPLPYALAFWGLAASLVFMVVWLSETGLSLAISVTTVGVAFLIFVAVTRMISETGLPSAGAPLSHVQVVYSTMDPNKLATSTIVALPFTILWSRTLLMPMLANGLKIADTARVRRRLLGVAVAIAIVLAIVVSFFVTIYNGYVYGGNRASLWYYESFPQRIQQRYVAVVPEVGKTAEVSAARAETEASYRSIRTWHVVYGAAFMTVLMLLRHLFLWWPIHPIGFVFSSTYGIQQIWVAVMIGWLIKFFVLRYGGVKLFRRLRPLFMGLILGEFLTAGAWFVVDFVIGQGFQLYR
jgi:hypothetical protein